MNHGAPVTARTSAGIVLLLITLLCAIDTLAIPEQSCARIVSTAPSITESLYKLGYGENVVGVSRYTTFPEAAREKAIIGDLFSLHIEAILQLQPTIVFSIAEQSDSLMALQRFKLPVISLNHRTLHGVLDSLETIAEHCGERTRGTRLRESLIAELRAVSATAPTPPRRYLILVAEEVESIGQQFWMSGSDGFYAELLPYVGGINVHTGRTLGLLQIAMEGAMALQPEIILLIVPPEGNIAETERRFIELWRKIDATGIPTVRAIGGDAAIIPGPRMVELAKRLVLISQEAS